MSCIVKNIPEIFGNKSVLGLSLRLLACSWCKANSNKESINPIHDMFILPLALISDPFFDSIPANLLRLSFTRMMNEFEQDNTLEKFVTNMQNNTNEEMVTNAHQLLSPFGYITLSFFHLSKHDKINMKILFWEHFKRTVDINTLAYRTSYIYKKSQIDDTKNERYQSNPSSLGEYIISEKKPFLSIGYAMDEGYTQNKTNNFMDSLHLKFNPNGEKSINNHYVQEIKFIQLIIKHLGVDKYNDLYTKGKGHFVVNEITSKSSSPCDFYYLFQMTDNQNWREAIALLKKMGDMRDGRDS